MQYTGGFLDSILLGWSDRTGLLVLPSSAGRNRGSRLPSSRHIGITRGTTISVREGPTTDQTAARRSMHVHVCSIDPYSFGSRSSPRRRVGGSGTEVGRAEGRFGRKPRFWRLPAVFEHTSRRERVCMRRINQGHLPDRYIRRHPAPGKGPLR